MGCAQAKQKKNISQRMIGLKSFKHFQNIELNFSTKFESHCDYDINKNPIKKRRQLKKLLSQAASSVEITLQEK